MNLLEELQSLAFHRAPATAANTAIDEARAMRGGAGSEGLSYEIALPALGPETYLLEKALPKLVYFLDCRGVHPPASGAVFVSLFSSEGLTFIDAGPLVEKCAKARGLTLAELVRRYGEQGTGEPLLLGGPA